MTLQGWLLIAAFIATLLALTKPAGLWLFALNERRRTPLHAVLGPVERGFYRLASVDSAADMGWRRHAVHMLVFNAGLALFTYAPGTVGPGDRRHRARARHRQGVRRGDGAERHRRRSTCWSGGSPGAASRST